MKSLYSFQKCDRLEKENYRDIGKMKNKNSVRRMETKDGAVEDGDVKDGDVRARNCSWGCC